MVSTAVDVVFRSVDLTIPSSHDSFETWIRLEDEMITRKTELSSGLDQQRSRIIADSILRFRI